MRNLLLLLSSLCFASTLLADDVYDEQIQILRTGEVIAAEDILAGGSTGPVLDACYAGLSALEEDVSITGIAPTFGARVKLNAVETQKSDGTVVTRYDENSSDCQNYAWTGTGWKKTCTDIEAVVEVGEMLICQDWVSYFPAGNLVPVYYEITVGDMTYIAAGAGQSPNFPNLPVLPGGGQFLAPQFPVAGFPLAGISLMSIGATIFPAAPVGEAPPWSPPGFGGTFTSNALVDILGLEDQFETDGVITIRTYTPVND
jgi:hypothetical protein